MKKYIFTLKPLTAVHIGTGDVITPLEYAIGKIEKKDVLFTYHTEKLVSLFNEKEIDDFNKLVSCNKIIDLRNYLSEQAKKTEYIKYCINYLAWISNEFKEKYEETLNDENNALEINTTYKNKKKIIIPGSSIKGSVRTAVLNAIADNRKDTITMQKPDNDQYLQRKLLRYDDAKSDPFRAVSISDVSYDPKENLIVGPMMLAHYNSNDNPTGINMYIEAIKGIFLNSETEGKGEIIIYEEILNKKVISQEKAFSIQKTEYHDIPKLTEYINNYYIDVFNDEYNKVQEGKMHDSIKQFYDQMADYIDKKMKENKEILIRIGRWSHIEAVTIKKYRRPFNRKGFGKTRTLLQYNGCLYPMGWCSLKIDTK